MSWRSSDQKQHTRSLASCAFLVTILQVRTDKSDSTQGTMFTCFIAYSTDHTCTQGKLLVNYCYSDAHITNYYIKTRILCVSVISEIAGMGGHSTTLPAPMWRDSPGELQQLLLNLTWCMVQEKTFRLFSANLWNHALHVTMVQYLRNWLPSWQRLSFSPSTGTQQGTSASLRCGKVY